MDCGLNRSIKIRYNGGGLKKVETPAF